MSLDATARRVGASSLRTAVTRAGEVPLPGSGSTDARFAALAEIAAVDLSTARLTEGHFDAVAICAEARQPCPPGLLGVWAADPPDGRVTAQRREAGWLLRGRKRWCSGARALDATLVTAHADDGYRLFAVDLVSSGVQPCEGTWPAVGMAASDSLDVELDAVEVPESGAIGEPGWYLERRGFWAGGAGVAACWYGGALGATRALHAAVEARGRDPYALAHLGAADSLCDAMWAQLRSVAQGIDDGLSGDGLRQAAWRVRAAVDLLADEVLRHCERGLGAGGLTQDPAMARRAADLRIYTRQHQAERALADLGALRIARP